MPFEMAEEEVAQQGLMMLNMDPPLHTRYRRLVNKGFTPRMVRDLEESIHRATDAIIDGVIEKGAADFVTEVAAELPLQVIAELLGVPQRGPSPGCSTGPTAWSAARTPSTRTRPIGAQDAAMELYAYAAELFARKRIDPHADLMSVLTTVEVDGERLSELELELFFLLLTVAGNETTRNLMSGAMHAFFEHPDQWQRLLDDRSLLPAAVEEMLRFVTPVMNFRRTAMRRPRARAARRSPRGTRSCSSTPRPTGTRTSSAIPTASTSARDPNPHIAFGGGGPHFCLGCQPGPHGDPGHVRAPARPVARHPAGRRRCSASSRSSSTGSSTSRSPSSPLAPRRAG